MKRTFYKITFGLLVAVSTTVAQVPTNGLVAHYPFNGNANDVSGNGNNGTNNGAILTTDRFGNVNSAYSFDGASSFIKLINENNFYLTNFSISFWMKQNSEGTQMLFANDGYLLGYNCYIIGKKIGIQLGNNVWSSFNVTEDIDITKWNNITYTYNGVVLTIHINNKEVLYYTFPVGVKYGNNKVEIGRNSYLLDQYFDGKIDDVRIYNRALNPNEISALYNESVITGTINNPFENSLKIYPNPATDYLIIENSNRGHSVLVTDVLGQTVFISEINQNQFRINLDKWTKKSLYIVKLLNSQNAVIETKKIIIQ